MAKAVVPSSIVFEVLEKDNYEDWSETIRAYLKAQDLWDVVESNKQPPKTEHEFKAWEKKNAAALHAIKISCGRHFHSKIRGISEANKAWRTLEANFILPEQVLNEHNYVEWREALEAYLKAQDLWNVVISDQKPPKIEEDEAQFKAWEKKNAAALQAIKISCGTNTLPYTEGIAEAHEAWLRLSAWFQTNSRSFPDNGLNFYLLQGNADIETLIADEENVDHELKLAYKGWDHAFSKRNLSAAIDLCEKYPLLLTKSLPIHRLVLNELIKLGGGGHEEKVVEILRSVPSDELRNCLSERGRGGSLAKTLSNTPLDVAVRVGAIEIARCLVQKAPELLFSVNARGLTPLAVAIGFHMNEMANMLYDFTPEDSFWTPNNAPGTVKVITVSFEVGNLDIPLKLLKPNPQRFILTMDPFNGKSLLYAAASAPHLFRRTYHHRFLPKDICEVLGPRLPLGSLNFKISGMDFLIHLGNAIKNLTHSKEKTDIVCEAFFEAIKQGNFHFILMLINSIKCIEHLTNNESRNMYMVAVEHRRAKIFSLLFWQKQDEKKVDASLIQDKWGNNLLHMVGAWTPPTALHRISKPAIHMKRELMWFKEVEELMPEQVRKSKNRDGKTPLELFNESHKDLMMEAGKWMKDSASCWTIVGPLIITIMFAAAFQVPGGSLQNKGYPVSVEKWSFKNYIVLVSSSLFLATIALWKFLEILSNYEDEKNFLDSLATYNVITGTLLLSLAAMMMAFFMGLFLTQPVELATFWQVGVFVTCLVFLPQLIQVFLPQYNPINYCFKFEPKTSIFNRNIGHEVDLTFEMLNQTANSGRNNVG